MAPEKKKQQAAADEAVEEIVEEGEEAAEEAETEEESLQVEKKALKKAIKQGHILGASESTMNAVYEKLCVLIAHLENKTVAEVKEEKKEEPKKNWWDSFFE